MLGPSPIRVALVHDSRVVLAGLRRLAGRYQDRVSVNPFMGATAEADLVLHGDLRQSPFRRVTPNALEVIYSYQVTPDELRTAVQRGCSGMARKDWTAHQLVEAIEGAVQARLTSPPGRVAGRVLMPTHPRDVRVEAGLSPREAELLRLIGQGLTNTDIANVMGVSVNSVKSYIRSAYVKIGVSRRTQAVLWSLANE